VTGNLVWTLHVVHQAGIYAGNATVAKAVVFPLLVRVIRYYRSVTRAAALHEMKLSAYVSAFFLLEYRVSE
jgi:hypothetical protein